MEMNEQGQGGYVPEDDMDEEQVYLSQKVNEVGSAPSSGIKMGQNQTGEFLSLVDVASYAKKVVDQGDVNVSDLSVPSYEAASFWYEPNLLQRSLTIGTKGGMAKLLGKWDYLYKTVCAPIHGNGDFALDVRDLNFNVKLAVDNILSGNPTLRAEDANLDLGRLDLQLQGGLMGTVLNMMTAPVEQKIRSMIQNDLKTEILRLLNDTVFEKLISKMKDLLS